MPTKNLILIIIDLYIKQNLFIQIYAKIGKKMEDGV